MNHNSFYIGAILRLPVTPPPLSRISCMPSTIPQTLSLCRQVAASGIVVIIYSFPAKNILSIAL